MFVIYGLREVGSNEYRYVGRTTNLKHRMSAHRAMSHNGRAHVNPQLAAWIEGIGDRLQVDVLEEPDTIGRQTEQAWIERLEAQGHRLLNMKPASKTYSNFGDMPPEGKQDVIEAYLDWFETV